MNKTTGILIAIIVIVALTAFNVAATSFTFPTAVYQNQAFRISASAVVCDATGTGHFCRINWTSSNGVDSDNKHYTHGKFWVALNQVDVYTVEIYTCNNGTCPSTPDQTSNVTVLDPATYGPMSLGWTFVPPNDLRVSGYAPQGATSVKLRFSDAITYYDVCQPVMQGVDPEYSYNYHPSSASWAPNQYFTLAYFFSNANCNTSGYIAETYGGDFDWLAISNIQTQLQQLNATLNGTNATLQAEIDTLFNTTFDLHTNITALQNQVDALNATINAMNHGTIFLDDYYNYGTPPFENVLIVYGEAPEGATAVKIQFFDLANNSLYLNRTTPVGAFANNSNYYELWVNHSDLQPVRYEIYANFYNGTTKMDGYSVSVIYDDLYLLALEEQVDAINETMLEINSSLWNETMEIREILDIMNHGTLNQRYFANQTLDVWGEAPMNASHARLCIIDASLNSTSCGDAEIDITGNIETKGDNSNYYGFEGVDVSGLDPTKEYNIQVWFGIPNGGYGVAAPFVGVTIDDLQDRVTNLEQQVQHIQGDLDLDWNSSDSKLTATVFFPYGSTYADLHVYDSDGNEVVSEARLGLLPGAGNVSTYTWSNVSDWAIDTYTIKVHFPDAVSAYQWRQETFDGLMLDWLENHELGFDLMDTQTFEVWNQQDSFVRKISWAFTAPEDGWYWFELVNPTSNNSENISKVFAGGTTYWINSHETKYFKNRNVRFPPEEGSYKVKLKAHNTNTGKTTKSNAFRLIIDDLTKPWPLFGVTTVAVTPDVSSYAGGVYWTNSTTVVIQGILGNETDWKSNSCELRNYKKHSPDQWEQPLYQEFDTGSSYACTWDLSLGDFTPIRNNGTEQFDMSICGTPLGAQVNCSPITIGYDTEAPAIDEASLNPGTRDAISGLWNFSANISDNGVVKNVTFVLTNKTDANMTCQVGPVNYNNMTGLWEVANFNTTDQNCTPDGYYNFTVYAQDYAGNTVEMMIDPIVDNTPPVVLNTSASGSYGENGGFSVSAQVTDNLAGVANATAEFVPYTCNDVGNVSVCMMATYNCTNKTYNTSSAVESSLNLSSCNEWSDATNTTCINGEWTGTLNGTNLSPNVHYEVRVHATDRANNENNAANVNSSLTGIYSQEGYIVTVNNVNTVAGVTFTLNGNVVGTNGTVPTGNVSLSNGGIVPLLPFAGDFQKSLTYNSIGKYTITADYTPNANCSGEVYTGSAIVSVVAIQRTGSSGGGGNACGPVWECGSWSACSSSGMQTRSCTDTNNCGYNEAGKPAVTQSCTYTAPAVTTGSSDTNTTTGTGKEDTNAGNTEPAPTEPSTPTNGVTGAVTGGGFGSLAWLLVLLGLIVIVLGGYFILRRRK